MSDQQPIARQRVEMGDRFYRAGPTVVIETSHGDLHLGAGDLPELAIAIAHALAAASASRSTPIAGMPADEAVRYRVMIEERDKALAASAALQAENADLRAALGLASRA